MIHYVLSGMLSSVCTQLLCSYMSFCAINLSIVFFIVKCSISRCVVQSVAALCRVWLRCAECRCVVQSVAALCRVWLCCAECGCLSQGQQQQVRVQVWQSVFAGVVTSRGLWRDLTACSGYISSCLPHTLSAEWLTIDLLPFNSETEMLLILGTFQQAVYTVSQKYNTLIEWVVIETVKQCSRFVECVSKLVNNSQSHHKSAAQLCHQELVEQLQHFYSLMFHTVVQPGF